MSLTLLAFFLHYEDGCSHVVAGHWSRRRCIIDHSLVREILQSIRSHIEHRSALRLIHLRGKRSLSHAAFIRVFFAVASIPPALLDAAVSFYIAMWAHLLPQFKPVARHQQSSCTCSSSCSHACLLPLQVQKQPRNGELRGVGDLPLHPDTNALTLLH